MPHSLSTIGSCSACTPFSTARARTTQNAHHMQSFENVPDRDPTGDGAVDLDGPREVRRVEHDLVHLYAAGSAARCAAGETGTHPGDGPVYFQILHDVARGPEEIGRGRARVVVRRARVAREHRVDVAVLARHDAVCAARISSVARARACRHALISSGFVSGICANAAGGGAGGGAENICIGGGAAGVSGTKYCPGV
jgi:hypothetical protein